MPNQPAAGDFYVNALLSNTLVAWIQDQKKFIAADMFPMVPVDMQSGIIPQYPLADLYRDDVTERAPGTEASGGGWATDNTLTYFCREFAYKHDIPDPIRATTQRPYDQDRDATAIVGQKMLISRERRFVTSYWTTGLWTKDWTGASNGNNTTTKTYWDTIGSTPIEDVKQACDTVEQLTGFRPNKLGMGGTVFTGLTLNPEFLDRVKYSGGPSDPALVDERAMAAVFGVDQVCVARAVYNSAAEGATKSNSYIAGRSALLVHAPQSPGILVPTAGYTFPWRSVNGSSGDLGARMKKYRMEWLSSDRLEAQTFYDMKLISADLGTFFSNISST